MARTITRLSHQILEHTTGGESPILLGIPTRGEQLAGRLADRMAALSGATIARGSLDVTAYRDDTGLRAPRPPARTVIPGGSVDEKHVVLVDDVLYSGRTVRAALDAIRELGRPAVVQLAVLVDRGHRELPIRADYVGKNLPTSREENIKVRLLETDGEDAVVITRRAPDESLSALGGAR